MLANLVAIYFHSIFLYIAGKTPTVSFLASESVSSTIPFILSSANKVISKNSSHDASGTYLTSIGATDYTTVYSKWPVIPCCLLHSELNVERYFLQIRHGY